MPQSAGAGGATFQALWENAKQQAANRSAADSREAGGASGAAAVDGEGSVPAEPVPERGDRPNLLLMVADDLAASDLTSYRKQGVGGPVHGLTPNLDGISRKGALFLHAHTVAPLCTPARFALLTGVQPACGLLEEGAPPQGAAAPPPLVSQETYLAPHHRTLPHKLRRLGYTTGLVGLWHLGTPESNAGKKLTRQVRDAPAAKWTVAAGGKVKRAVLAEYATVQEHVRQVAGFEHAERVYAAPLDSEALLLPHAMKVHNVEWVADGAAQFIQKQGRSLFFLYVGFTLPHGPDAGSGLRADSASFTPAGVWKRLESMVQGTGTARAEVRKRAREEVARGRSAAGGGADGFFPEGWQGHKSYELSLAWLDRGVGTVLWALQRRGVAQSTLTIFTSDHAALDKGHCYTQATRMPLLVQWPQALPTGVVAHGLVSSLDVAATLLDAARTVVAVPLGGEPADAPAPGRGRAAPPPPLPPGGASLLPALRLAKPEASLHAPLHTHLLCEMGRSRAVLTRDYRYLFAPPAPGRGGSGAGGGTFGAEARHPAYASDEQLYDQRADPAETRELISERGLRDSGSPKNASLAAALQSLQLVLQQSLQQLSWDASCAELKG